MIEIIAMAVLAVLGALFGGVAFGKRKGKAEQAATQNQAAADAAKDRADVDQSVRTADDAELDDRMRPYIRKD